jgi:uncharacterized protein (TIGR03437 family)
MKTLSFKRAALFIGVLFLAALPAFAQGTLISVSVEPKGAPYQVDGTLYYAPTSFTWPKDSKHILEVISYCVYSPTEPIADVCQTRYIPGSWTTNKGPIDAAGHSPIAIITAAPEITSYKGTATVEHRLRLSFFDVGGSTANPVAFPASKCIGPKPSAGAPGLACVNGQCYRESVDLWLSPGDITLEAIPYDGFVFTGWYTGGVPEPFVNTYKVTGPRVLNPRFAPAKRVQIVTDPPQLRVLVDHTEVITSDPQNYVPTCSAPGFFDFAEGSTHVLGAPSPQIDINSKEWVFDSWSIGGGQNMIYKADRANVTEKLIAKFVPGIRVSLLMPQGLKLIVDGRDTWPSYNFIWGAGTKHVITAPAEQTDQNGRKYVFKGWSNGGPATQEIALDTNNLTGVRLTAEYSMLGMMLLQSNFPVTMQVGEQTCQTPCTLHREAGTELQITAPKTVPLSEGSRLELQSLSGETSGMRTAKLGADAVVLVANYRPTHRILVTADPANGADFRMDPPTPDAYYPANTRVQVYSTSRVGYRFKRWEGDTVDRFSPATVVVSGPLRLKAILEATPEISQAGVRNGAGETPVAGVAPGSIISIYGGSLAPSNDVGPSNPLTQTLSGVTVNVAGRILPLFFVSPEQINAQLPYDLPLGTNNLTIKNKDLPDVSAKFEVMRNAPGLITSAQGNHLLATTTRVDGPAISSENPIRSGELINLFGTGFGPYRISPPDGFGVNESDGYRLTDAVQVVIGDQTLVPEYVGPATGLPGVIVLRLRTPVGITDQSTVRLKVVTNGVSSNEVVLPTASAYSATADENAL